MNNINNIGLAEFENFEMVKCAVYPFAHNLFSAEKENLAHTKDLMVKYPHIATNGVCVFFAIVSSEETHMPQTETVTIEMMDHWGITTTELFEIAFQNLEELPMRLNRVKEYEFYSLDTSSDVWPNFESARFLSKRSLEQMAEIVGNNFFIFPTSAWKSYLIGADAANGKDTSTLLTYMLAKGGMPKDIFLRHGYLFENHKLKLVELTASRTSEKDN